MQKPDLKKIALKEAAIIASSLALALGMGRFIPGASDKIFWLKLAGLIYLASIAFRLAGIFIRITFVMACILGLIGIALIFLASRFPVFFSFFK